MGDLNGLGLTDVLLPGENKAVTLAVYMPTQVGNEANQLTSAKGTEGEPTIFLGLTLNATQTPYEEDSFDNTYDENAFNSTPATKPVNPTGDTILKTLDEKVEVTVPHDAVAEGVDKLTLTVTPTDVPELDDFDAATQNAVAYNVKVDTLKENNEVSLTAKMFAGLGRKNAKLYCNNAIVGTASYDESTGFISYTATSFSADDIYTIVWDKELFTVTYKTNTDQVIGTMKYEVGAANSFPETLDVLSGWSTLPARFLPVIPMIPVLYHLLTATASLPMRRFLPRQPCRRVKLTVSIPSMPNCRMKPCLTLVTALQ